MESSGIQLKIFSQVLFLENDKPNWIETIASQREPSFKVKGQKFIIDEDELILKIIKKKELSQSQKPMARFYLDELKSLSFQLQIFPTEFLKENAKQRILKIMLGDDNILEICLVTQNRILISVGEHQYAKKSHFILNEWNTLGFNFDKEREELIVLTNAQLRVSIPFQKQDLKELLKAVFIIGGHSESLKQEQMKSKNLFHGLLKNFKVSLNQGQEEHVVKKENKERSLLEENSEEFAFLHNLYEIAKFDPKRYIYHQSTVPLAYRKPRDRKVLICHDIPSGLLEERLSQGLYPSKKIKQIQENWYRFNHWGYIDIFIYFGHYTVTIPPPSYINIAHQYGVKILGTLIFEWEEGGKEAQLMLDGKIVVTSDLKFIKDAPDGNKFYASKLVEIAKFFGFDGYLMNFECKIEDTDVLLQWLQYLKEEIHKEIPGSLIIWYDSVLHNGTLQWQSALNENNYKFFQATDAFFTDYHWGLQNLQVTMDTFDQYLNKGEEKHSSYDIYIGNDIYGRGTYGGGQDKTYVAIEEIMKYNFSISLFGQAYWYENLEGRYNASIFQLNEDLFWKGRQLKIVADSSGYTFTEENSTKKKMLRDWNMEEGNGKWKVNVEPNNQYTSIACFKHNSKKLEITVEQLLQHNVIKSKEDIMSLIYISTTKGTPPNCEDPFRIILKLLDSNNQEILVKYLNDTINFSLCKADGTPTSFKLDIFLDELLLQKLDKILVIEEGQDAEYWGGHYGTQFSEERLYLELKAQKEEQERKNLLQQFKNTQMYFETISTFFNIGQGKKYYIDGIAVINQPFSNLNEYDLFLLSSLNGKIVSEKLSNFTYELTYEGAHFVGGSSFLIQGQLKENDYLIIPLQDLVYYSEQESIKSHETPMDIKVVFHTKYQDFNGELVLLFENDHEEQTDELVIFNQEIKQFGLIYITNGWATFEARMIDFKYLFTKLSFKIKSQQANNIDLRLGMISIVPSALFTIPQQISLKQQRDPILIENIKTYIDNKETIDVHLEWVLHPQYMKQCLKYYRVFRNDQFLGVVRLNRFFDNEVVITQNETPKYRIEALSLRNEVIAKLDINVQI